MSIALDLQDKPTLAGVAWSEISAGATDGVYFLAPSVCDGIWTHEEIASVPLTSTIDSASDTKPGLGYMQNGEPIVCWASNGLRCASRASGVWTEQLITANAEATDEVEVRVAQNGCCHVTYSTANGAVRHATDCQ